MIAKYKEELLKAKSIHFDRWNSRLKDIYYAYKPQEVCAEIESVSATTGKIRKGKKIKKYDEAFGLAKVGHFTLKSYAGIPLLDRKDLLRKELSGKRFKFKKVGKDSK